MSRIKLARNGIALGVALTEAQVLRPVGVGAAVRMSCALAGHRTNPPVLPSLSAARWPNRTAVVDDRGTVTYAELSATVDAVAGGLQRVIGAGTGDGVAVMCRNSRYFVAGLFGVLATGADALLLNTDFHAEALSRTLDRHHPAAVLCDAEFVPVLRSAGYTGPLVICFGSAGSIAPSVDAWLRMGVAAPARKASGRLVILTSGTTGIPKGVPREPGVSMIAGTAASVIHRTGLRAGAVIAVGIPMFHGFGLGIALLGITLGGKLVLRRRFDAENALATIAAHRVEMFAGVPVMLQRILAVPAEKRADHDLASLRVVLSGGAPLAPAVAEAFIATFGDVLYNGYGSSEVGIGTLATPADLRVALGTVGRPVSGTDVRILGVDGSRLPAWAVGQIYVGSALGFAGYSGGGDKARTDGLISTGDLGYLDPGGRLFIAGRADDMIVSGGENVYPQEVENVLATHPAVCDAAVIGIEDADYGQRLVAYAVVAPGQDIGPEELRAFLHDRVSRFQRPREIAVVPEIPRNPTGKIDRKALRASGAS
ncbi:AMP-binding protein [Nocardia sp. NPDC059764]|uniref:AMP-binding protein n=1 Tax=Nocardia sp. NPDC059764 TaxID=3346939 RepID=UPI0036543A10